MLKPTAAVAVAAAAVAIAIAIAAVLFNNYHISAVMEFMNINIDNLIWNYY